MSQAEFYERMVEIKLDHAHDPEAMHSAADRLMAETLIKLGYHGGIAVFNSMTRWYA